MKVTHLKMLRTIDMKYKFSLYMCYYLLTYKYINIIIHNITIHIKET